MDKMASEVLESKNSNDGGANGSTLIATMILHPMVRDLAFSASKKAQNRVLKQAAALKRDANTEFRNKFCCTQAEKRARELESTRVEVTKASTPQITHDKRRPVLNAAGSFVDVVPNLTSGHCSYGGHAWVINSCLDSKGRTLVSVRYALEGNIEKHVELPYSNYSSASKFPNVPAFALPNKPLSPPYHHQQRNQGRIISTSQSNHSSSPLMLPTRV
jgi:hypothetical protein